MENFWWWAVIPNPSPATRGAPTIARAISARHLFYAGLDRWPLGDKRMLAVPAERTMEAIGRYGDAPCKGTEN